MISYIRGKLVEKTPTYVVVETGGIGFKIEIPLSSFKALGDVGSGIKIRTYLHAREDILQLFGFATEEEKELFQLLISVSGIGPRLAQGILSGISVREFKLAVRDKDIAKLTSAPGVGKKTAERLILELREKIGEVKTDRIPVSFTMTPTGEEAVLALISLGYKRSRAVEVVQKLVQKEPSLLLEELIRRALQTM